MTEKPQITSQPKTTIPPTTTSTPREEAIQDLGDFKVAYAPVQNQDYAELQRVLKESKLFEDVTERLNGVLALPTEIPVLFGECGQPNAFYDPSIGIVICYELIDYFANLYAPYAESENALDSAIIQATFFVFYHEMGHALVDVLDLPITGKEEDAVDQLATLVLIESGDEDAALNAATGFLLTGSEKTNIEDLAFWGEHSLDLQRFYNIACWVYGKNPEGHTYLVDEGILPEDRAVRCASEYEQLSNSWNRLLEPHLKEIQ